MSAGRSVAGVKPGDSLSFDVEVTGAHIDAYARVARDADPIHLDDEYARNHGLSGRIAHGTYFVSLMSGAATAMEQKYGIRALSYGYDRVRFVRPVPVGDSVTVTYTVVEVDPAKGRVFANVEVTTGSGDVVAVARHIGQATE